MKKLLFLLLLPTLSFADRLGSLRSDAQVLLSTAGIKNTNALQTGATFYVSSGTVNGPLHIFNAFGGMTLHGGTFVSSPGVFPDDTTNGFLALGGTQSFPAMTTVNNGAVVGIGVNIGQSGVLAGNGGLVVNLGVSASTMSLNSFNATTTSTTVTGAGGERVAYQLSVGSFTGSGLSTCGDSTHALAWSSTNNLFTCQAITAAGGGSGSPIAITTGSAVTYANPAISTPMLVGVYDQSQFGILATGTTAFITIAFSTISVSATYTAFSTNSIVLADATGGAFTVTLSTMNSNGSSIQIGKVYTVSRINSGANAVTVAGATGTIYGDATQVLNSQWATIDVFWQGMNWGIK